MNRNVLIWFGTVVGSCLLTLFVTEWWNKPRATLDIAKVEIRSPGQPADKLVIGQELSQKTQEHPYIDGLDSDSTFEEVGKALEDLRKNTAIASRTLGHIDALIKLLSTQSMAFAVDKRREEFIGRLTSKREEAHWLERTAKSAMDEYEFHLQPKYSAHPPNAKALSVHVEGATYDLSEENEDEFAKRVQARSKDVNAYAIARREAHATNLWRRLLVYYEPEVLNGFLKTCQSEVEKNTKVAEELISALTSKIEQTRRQHLYVSILVSNSGDTPLPIQPIGILRLEVPNSNKQGSQTVLIRLTGIGEAAETTIVEKGKPKLLLLMSGKPLSTIIEDNPKLLGGDDWTAGSAMSKSRFMQLWQAKTAGLEASVKIARAGLNPKEAAVRESDRRPMSLSSTDVIYEQLEK